MIPNEAPLHEPLCDRILERLGLSSRPAGDIRGLASVYRAWCEQVPFDNSRKLIHIASGSDAPLAGDNIVEFFEAWLRWGTGGTCWAGNGALCALLQGLGFEAVRGIGTMMVYPNLPPNHGTVVVHVDGHRYLVDASMLFAEPLLLDMQTSTEIVHAAHGARCTRRDGNWQIHWRPLHMPGGLDCRIDKLEATAAEFCERHEQTRGWSPFNFAVNVRRNIADTVVGLAFSQRIVINGNGAVTQTPVSRSERDHVLCAELGISPELVRQLPDDRPTPPPPMSRTATSRQLE